MALKLGGSSIPRFHVAEAKLISSQWVQWSSRQNLL